MPPKFEEHCNTFNCLTGYQATNEEPILHKMLLHGRRFQRTGGIAGGGEIPIFVLLPVSDQVVVVDHSYASLAITWMKTLLLAKLGARATKALMIEQPYEKFAVVANELKAELPEAMRAHMKLNSYSYKEITREWTLISTALMEKCRGLLDNLTLLHGDLKDLKAHGPYDLVYLSNALEHTTNRENKAPTVASAVDPLVKPNGLLLQTGTWNTAVAPGWKLVKALNGTRTAWAHNLLQRAAPAAP